MTTKENHTLRIHSKIPRSLANGPGKRAVIWLQGCPLKCSGCFNTNLWNPREGSEVEIKSLLSWLCSIKGITGLSVSGGEPTEQLSSLLPFLSRVREKTDISILLFSGRTLEEIAAMPQGEKLLSLLDVLIDGRYELKKANPPGVWPSSSNQRIHCLTDRYVMQDFLCLPASEVLITEAGDILESGITAIQP